MRVNLDTGWLEKVRQVPTAHQDERPQNMPMSLIVVHGISLPPGQFGSDDVIDLFTGQLDVMSQPYYAWLNDARVSAHVWIRRTGEIIQFVPFHARAWHAGLSRWGVQQRCNDFSIGIELEGTDTCPYTDEQYQQLMTLIDAIRMAYPSLASAPIVGHSDIAPLRKTDPGIAFDWLRMNETKSRCP